MKKNSQKQTAAEQISALTRKKNLDIGDKLPSERRLAEILKVSRNTVREAIRELETRGRVKTKSGSGCFVTNIEDSANWSDLRGNTTIEVLRDHMEAISAISPVIASGAVEKSSEKDIKKLKRIVSRLGNAIINRNNGKTVTEIINFNKALSEISGNRFFMMIMQELTLERYILSKTIPECSDEKMQALFKNTVETINCFKNRDAAKAAELVRRNHEEKNALFEEIAGRSL